MSFINFSKASCKNCYKCLRSCPVKAIKIINEQAEIIEERCVSCGRCLVVCPQNARNIKSDLETVKDAIKNRRKVAASLAPSFTGAFMEYAPGQVVAALKALGLSIIEETAVGADIVSEYYRNYFMNTDKDNLITTCCPSANYLIEKYFPSLVDCMIPLVSPMIINGRMLKRTYGMDSFVVFIGPCIAKKYEAVEPQTAGSVDAVLTFDELAKWIDEENIDIKSLKSVSFERKVSRRGRGFPIKGGIIEASGSNVIDRQFDYISVDGNENCIEVLSAMEKGDMHNTCLEINMCSGGCIGGPGMNGNGYSIYKRREKVLDYMNNIQASDEMLVLNMCDINNMVKIFSDKSIESKQYKDKDIKSVLCSMGKYEKHDELNCGVCGYNTCVEKAKAVLDGMAEIDMCLHFMRNKAESLTNVIFKNSPNGIILLDKGLKVIEFNPAAEKIFSISSENIKGFPISILVDDTGFARVIESKEGLYNHKVSYPRYGVTLLENILYLQKENIVLAIMIDITSGEKQEKELARVRENTLNAAQEVINKQMMVAQEIASLLGETTAETKVILTKLKNIAMGEIGGQ